MSLIEKVARALCADDGLAPDDLRPDGVANWKPYVTNARAAIAALRSCATTESMVVPAMAAKELASSNDVEFAIRAVHRWIDAALKP